MDRYNDFVTDHLSNEQKKIASVVKSVIKDVMGREAFGGGCRAFWTPEEWQARKEQYGTNSKLVLVHDGGDLARFCSYDYQDYDAVERLNQALEKAGYYFEQCTTWYSAVYESYNKKENKNANDTSLQT